MGRRRSREARLIEQALVTAYRNGERQGLARAVEVQARDVFGEETFEAAHFVERHGPEEGLRLLGFVAAERWPTRWRERLSPLLAEAARDAIDPKAARSGGLLPAFDLRNPEMAQWFQDYTVPLSGQLADTSREKVTAAIQAAQEAGESVPDAARRVRALSEEIGPERAKLIARTELHKSSIGASDAQARASGVVKARVWRATLDSRTRPEHAAMHGETVGMDEVFSNGSQYPNEPNCRCHVEYVLDYEAIRGGAA
jgi:SPP1 gp7 family putative phage head morphogenesis protein